MRLAGSQRGYPGIDEARQVFQLQRMEMPAVLVRLQFAVVRVDVIGMIMVEHPKTEMERPQQDEAVNQRRTDFEKFLHRLDHTPGKGGHNSLSVDISPSISKFKDLWQIFSTRPGLRAFVILSLSKGDKSDSPQRTQRARSKSSPFTKGE